LSKQKHENSKEYLTTEGKLGETNTVNISLFYSITTIGSMDTPYIRRFLQNVSAHLVFDFFYIHLYSSVSIPMNADECKKAKYLMMAS
jgi:hypothetical protein